MSQFFLISLCAYLVGHAYLLQRLYSAFGGGGWLVPAVPWFCVMGFWTLIMRYLTPGGAGQDYLTWAVYCWLPFAIFCLLLFGAADVFRLLGLLWRRLLGPGARHGSFGHLGGGVPRPGGFFGFDKRGRPVRRGRGAAVCILLAALGLYAYSLYEAHTIRAVHLTLETPKLEPGAKPLRIAFFADVHLNAWNGPKALKRVLDCVNAQKPDIILIGGDLVDTPTAGREAELAMLTDLSAPGGVFAVMGNHEAMYSIADADAFIRKTGMTLLRAEEEESLGITIVGVDDPRVSTEEGTTNDDPLPLLEAADQSKFIILLDHRPWLRKESIGLFDLQLSGHSHGGQIWPARYVMERIYGTKTGLSHHTGPKGKSDLFVTVGTGFWKMPMRFLTPPEVVVIELAPAKALKDKSASGGQRD